MDWANYPVQGNLNDSGAGLMKRVMMAALMAATGVLLSDSVNAQNFCAEGRTASGLCVNANLAEAMRQGAVIYSQPKLSYTHYPVLPSSDLTFRYPNQLNPDPLLPSATGTPLPPPPPPIVIIIP